MSPEEEAWCIPFTALTMGAGMHVFPSDEEKIKTRPYRTHVASARCNLHPAEATRNDRVRLAFVLLGVVVGQTANRRHRTVPTITLARQSGPRGDRVAWPFDLGLPIHPFLQTIHRLVRQIVAPHLPV